MKRYTYLGVAGEYCCVLSSLAPFEQLTEHNSEIDRKDFYYEDATNWCGCDTIERTCRLEVLTATGRNIKLEYPITFHGTDYDSGHEYGWSFTVEEIWEVDFG